VPTREHLCSQTPGSENQRQLYPRKRTSIKPMAKGRSRHYERSNTHFDRLVGAPCTSFVGDSDIRLALVLL